MIHLHGLGHFHPEAEIDNAFFASIGLDTDETWIQERVGIRTRRTVLPLDYIRATRNADPRAAREAALYDNAALGVGAAQLALARSGLTPMDIGMVISGGCTSDYSIPPDACRIAETLGIVAPAFDLSASCASFGAQLHWVGQLRPEASPDFVLLVQPEANTRVVDYRDRATAVLWGDGAAAAVVSLRVPARIGVESTTMGSDPSGWRKVCTPHGGHFQQDGPAVQRFAVRRTREILGRLLATSGPGTRFVGHQANLLMLESACRQAGIPPARHLYNVDAFGNTGAAGAPSVLSQHWDTLHAGEPVALAVVGAGLSWAGAVLSSATRE